MNLLERLRAKLSEGDAKGFYFLAQRISSAIISGDFKHDPAEWESSDDVTDVPADRLPPAFGGSAAFRPYFEVLFVTPHQPSRWQHMIHEVRRLRRPEDEFVYEPLIVGSAEDAVAAAIVNPNIAAVALYEGFALRTLKEAPLIRALLDAYGVEAEIGEEDLALNFASILKRLRPELDVYLLTRPRCREARRRCARQCRQEGFLPDRGAARAAPVDPRGRAGALCDALLRQPQELRRPSDRHVPRAADCPGQGRVQVRLDPRHGRILWRQPVPRRKLCHDGRPRQPARADRKHQESPGDWPPAPSARTASSS